MKAHPAAELFPLMSVQEYTNLKNDIAEHGVREPIWVYKGQILDGRHRDRACSELGIECPATTWDGSEAGAVDFVLSVNLKRRHLTASQAAMVAAKYANIKRGSNQHVKEHPPNGGTSVSQAQAAAATGATVRSTQRAAEVLSGGNEELIEAVAAGKTTVTAAARTVKEQKPAKRKPEQKKANKLGAQTVPKRDYDKLKEEYDALRENRDDLADEVEAYSIAETPNEAAIKIQRLQLELKSVKRARDDAMTRVVELDKRVKYWEKEARKLGWTPNKGARQ